MDRVFLRKMHAHLWSAKMCKDNPDEQGLNDAAYMLQQTVEIGLKQILRENGTDYVKTHNIESLLQRIEDQYFWFPEDFYETLLDKAPTLTSWETFTRYDDDYMPARDRVIKMEAIVSKFVDFVDDGFRRLDSSDEDNTDNDRSEGIKRMKFE